MALAQQPEEATATGKHVYLDKPIVVLASQVVLEHLVAVRLRAKAYVVDMRPNLSTVEPVGRQSLRHAQPGAGY